MLAPNLLQFLIHIRYSAINNITDKQTDKD